MLETPTSNIFDIKWGSIHFDTPLIKPQKEEILKRETLEKDIAKIKEDIVWARENNNTSVETWLLEMLEIKQKKLETIFS